MDLTPQEFSKELEAGRIEGICAPRFLAVAEQFAANFESGGEVGASLCLMLDGETVVDLWGGLSSTSRKTPWTKDTISIVYSCTKGALAILAHHLSYLGKLDLDAPVVSYWPEFGQAGKDRITVSMLLDHTAGLAGLNEPAPDGTYADWDAMTRLLARSTPLWEPGTRGGYHGITFGWLVGEVIRRVTGKSVGRAFDEMIAAPLSAPFWIGLPEALEDRVSLMIPSQPGPNDVISDALKRWMADPQSITAKAFANSSGGFSAAVNTRAGRAAEVPGANGVSNARGLARIYAPLACGGRLHEVTLTDRAGLARMSETSYACSEDAVLLTGVRMSLGFMKSIDNRRKPPGRRESAIIGIGAFGHPGMGGSIGFADPDCGLSFGYSMNKMGVRMLLNERGQSLVDAAYRALGYSTDAPGAWIN